MIAIKALLGHAAIASSERSAQLSHQRVQQVSQQTIRTVMAKTRVEGHDGAGESLRKGCEPARGTTAGPGPRAPRVAPSRARALMSVAGVSRQSAKARRAIMPRCALRPVWTSRRSIERSSAANRATGIRRVTRVEGTPVGRPAFFWGVGAAVDGGRPPAGAGLGLAWGGRPRGIRRTGLSGIALAIRLHAMIYVV